jgi:predicted phage terminase large subunit-like protein
VQQTFAAYFTDPQGRAIAMAPHHDALWQWVWALRPGQAARPFIALWPRGGGKSTTAELACVCMAVFGLRRYGLYVSESQEQADDHVGNVAHVLEQPSLGIERSLSKYGYSRGWRGNRVRTADDFMLDAVGLDTAARGAKSGIEQRPDVLILDDLDSESDSPPVIAKKITTLTRKLLPAGAASLAVLGIQNLPNTDGIFAQLADGRADFLRERQVSGPYPALEDFAATPVPDPTGGASRWQITRGVPTWAGQDVAACEALLNIIGLPAFLAECQHAGRSLEQTLFQRQWFSLVTDWPREGRRVRFWDLASTVPDARRPDPDWTVGVLMAMVQGRYWILDVQRTRGRPHQVDQLLQQTAALDGRAVPIRWEEEGGASGKRTTDDLQRRVLVGYDANGVRATGDKYTRMRPLASAAEAGNVCLLQGAWNAAFLDEVCDIPRGAHDDQGDAAAGAQAFLAAPTRAGVW